MKLFTRHEHIYQHARAMMTVACLGGLLLTSCSRKDIEFGDTPENSYTRLVYVDTVQAVLSTVLLDSFVTNSAESFLVGTYSDPYLGRISTQPFFQMTIPSEEVEITNNTQYDSLCLVVHLDHYYYGDTTQTPTLQVYRLAQPIDYTYATYLYNTSSVPVEPVLLGSLRYRIHPGTDDSIRIRLSDNLGQELFEKLKQQSSDITSGQNFTNYFNGLSLSVSANDTLAVYGLSGGGNNITMRLFYHTSIPYTEKKQVDFPSLANTYAFNRVVSDRSGTLLQGVSGLTEISSSLTGHASYTQVGAGLYSKITFPSLKGILENDQLVKLIDAKIVLRPLRTSFDLYQFRLPDSLYLARTDASNIPGSLVYDPTGTTVQYANPVIDELYGLNSNYSFDVTAYINNLLTTDGTADDGFFLIQKETATMRRLDRAVMGDGQHPSYKTQLQLTLAMVDNN